MVFGHHCNTAINFRFNLSNNPCVFLGLVNIPRRFRWLYWQSLITVNGWDRYAYFFN